MYFCAGCRFSLGFTIIYALVSTMYFGVGCRQEGRRYLSRKQQGSRKYFRLAV